eukprot:2670698-Rhodomonas_salina.2
MKTLQEQTMCIPGYAYSHAWPGVANPRLSLSGPSPVSLRVPGWNVTCDIPVNVPGYRGTRVVAPTLVHVPGYPGTSTRVQEFQGTRAYSKRLGRIQTVNPANTTAISEKVQLQEQTTRVPSWEGFCVSRFLVRVASFAGSRIPTGRSRPGRRCLRLKKLKLE